MSSYCDIAPGHPFHGPYHDQEYGSFVAWLDHRHPLSKEAWVKLFKKTFQFTDGEITGEFLMSTGYLPGAHAEGCPVFEIVRERKPRWMETA